MSSTDIAALLNDQKTLSEGVAKLAKLKKESEYHGKQAKRKAEEAVTLAAENAALEAKLTALTGTAAPAPEKPKEEKPGKGK